MSFRYYHITPLITIILSLSLIIDWSVVHIISLLKEYLNITLLRAPGTAAIIVLLLSIYDKYLWKVPYIGALVSVPHMAGRYSGKIRYKFNGREEEKECIVEVTQTSSRIKVYSYFNNTNKEKSSSKSLVEDIKMDEDGFYEIYAFYLNSGDHKNGGLDCHEGANKLRYIPRSDNHEGKLVGHYFTNRLTQTRGEIEAFYESEKIKGEF